PRRGTPRPPPPPPAPGPRRPPGRARRPGPPGALPRRRRTTRAGLAARAASLRSTAAPQARVPGLAEPLPHQVESEHHPEDREARHEEEPGRVEQVAASVGEDVPPGGEGRLHTEAQEAERRLG